MFHRFRVPKTISQVNQTIVYRQWLPYRFVKRVIRNTLFERRQQCINKEEFLYLKLPFINDEYKRRALSVINRSRLNNVKIQFMNGRPLSKVFAPPKNKQDCPRGCETCKLSTKPNCCLTKNVVYEIRCSTCGAAYIGETSRTIGTRIKEHLTMEKQTVFKHLLLHKKHKENKIIWKILHSNVRNDEERRCIEACEIQNYKQRIMNGCIGRTICIE